MERSEWKRALRLADALPDSLRVDPEFAVNRISMLEGVGAKHAVIDEAVEQLVRRHPQDRGVSEFAFEHFANRGTLDRAREVLLRGRTPQSLPSSSIAYAVRLSTLEGNSNAALAAAHELWRRGSRCKLDDAERAVAAIVQGGLTSETAAMLGTDYAHGEPVSAAFGRALVFELSRLQLVPELGRLAAVLRESKSAQANDVLAAVLAELADHGERDVVDDMLGRERDRLRSDDALWASVGYIHVSHGENLLAVQWLANWSERARVAMYTIANLGIAAVALQEFDRASRALRFALERLLPDDTRPLVVRLLLLSELGARAHAAFLEDWSRHGPPREPHDYNAALACFHDLLAAEPRGMALVRLCRRFRATTANDASWTADRWRELVSTRLAWHERALAAMLPKIREPPAAT
jgi:tetratricopeptide (TPR) repeat protein